MENDAWAARRPTEAGRTSLPTLSESICNAAGYFGFMVDSRPSRAPCRGGRCRLRGIGLATDWEADRVDRYRARRARLVDEPLQLILQGPDHEVPAELGIPARRLVEARERPFVIAAVDESEGLLLQLERGTGPRAPITLNV
jgi:hypothetical protein